MKAFRIFLAMIALASATNVSAQKFLSAEPAEEAFNLGVRVGVNTSNRTFGKGYFNEWNKNSWGTGFEAGVVANLNMRDYFSLQPGFFFESRSGNYSYAQSYFDSTGEKQKTALLGHYRSYNFTVPVMASFRFNLSHSLRWTVEAGPYAQFRIHSDDNDKIKVISPQVNTNDPVTAVYAKASNFDAGLKIGTGLLFRGHYSFNVHYLAGGRKAWKAPHSGGSNKAWTFTLGYDF